MIFSRHRKHKPTNKVSSFRCFQQSLNPGKIQPKIFAKPHHQTAFRTRLSSLCFSVHFHTFLQTFLSPHLATLNFSRFQVFSSSWIFLMKFILQSLHILRKFVQHNHTIMITLSSGKKSRICSYRPTEPILYWPQCWAEER